MNRYVLFIFSSIFFLMISLGCSSSKVYRLMQGGEVSAIDYKVEIPFEMRLGLIIIKVTIQGDEYDFLFDTGAPNVVSLELGETLGLKSVGKTNTRGSLGQRHKVDYANIDNLQIGGIHYLNTAAAIMDLNRAVVIECMDIDGILGANVMRNSIWQIDYEKQVMILTSHTDSLMFSTNLDTIPFTTQPTGTPKIKIQIGDIVQSGVTLDTGSGGHIDLHHGTYKSAKERDPNMPTAFGFGNSSSGIYGIGNPDTTIYFKPDSVKIGTIQLGNQICYASVTKTSSLLGTRFLENYIVTLDWERNQIVLDSVKAYDNSVLESFGYKSIFNENELQVGFVFNSKDSFVNPLQLKDHIIQVDSIDFTHILKSDFCKLILDTTKSSAENRTITVQRDSSIFTYPLKKSVILE